jgi:ABC-type transport system substrate-binding protein
LEADYLEADEDGELVYDGPMQSLVIQYLGMNNNKVNVTIRKASAYAFNYTYVIEEIMEGQAVRLHGPLPEGMTYSNTSIPYITQDVEMARQILIDAGIAPTNAQNFVNDTPVNDAWWRSVAATTPIANHTYTFNTDNAVRTDIGTLLKDNLAAIGIFIELNGTTWADYIYTLFNVYADNSVDWLEYYFIGWGPDFNDADNYITPLFSNTSASNGAQVNDPELQALMLEAKVELNVTARQELYNEIQDILINDIVPWIFVYQGAGYDAYSVNVTGISPNVMGKVQFKFCAFTGDEVVINQTGIVGTLGQVTGTFESWSSWDFETWLENINAPETTETTTETTTDEPTPTTQIPGYELPLVIFGILGAVGLLFFLKKRKMSIA